MTEQEEFTVQLLLLTTSSLLEMAMGDPMLIRKHETNIKQLISAVEQSVDPDLRVYFQARYHEMLEKRGIVIQ